VNVLIDKNIHPPISYRISRGLSKSMMLMWYLTTSLISEDILHVEISTLRPLEVTRGHLSMHLPHMQSRFTSSSEEGEVVK